MRSWVMSAARRWRSAARVAVPACRRCASACGARASRSLIQVRAWPRLRSSRPSSGAVSEVGHTRLWTTVAQTMPTPISSTRARALSNSWSGRSTEGKPISAAV
jgi:hypothetical protein